MHPKLVAIAGPWRGASFLLPEGAHLVGRDGESQIRLDESAVSRRHCEITRAGNRCTVRDLGSHNSTLLNGKPITEAHLTPDDEIQIGASTFLFVVSEVAELRPEDSVYLVSLLSKLASGRAGSD
jgi:pSer/pThr/pTyr-binding forkhead associated (FHA) protein